MATYHYRNENGSLKSMFTNVNEVVTDEDNMSDIVTFYSGSASNNGDDDLDDDIDPKPSAIIHLAPGEWIEKAQIQ